MADPESIPEDVGKRALRRLALGGRDVGAAVWRDITEPALPGRAVRTVVTDGESFEVVDWIDEEAPRDDLFADAIEEAVEERICGICPDEDPMPVLRALGLWFENGRIPIKLGADAVADPEPAESREAPRPIVEPAAEQSRPRAA